MDVIHQVFVSLVSSTVVVSGFAFISKKYLEKVIDHAFAKRQEELKLASERDGKVMNFVTETQLGIYPELLELVYRLRHCISTGITKRTAFEWDAELRPLCAALL